MKTADAPSTAAADSSAPASTEVAPVAPSPKRARGTTQNAAAPGANITVDQLSSMLSRKPEPAAAARTTPKPAAKNKSVTPDPQAETTAPQTPSAGAEVSAEDPEDNAQTPPDEAEAETEATEETVAAENADATETEGAEEEAAAEITTQEPNANATDDDELSPAELAKLPKGMQKLYRRINKVTSERNQLRAQVAAAASKPDAGAATRPGTGTDPFTGAPEVRQIDGDLAQTEAILAWTEANADGGELTDSKGQKVYYEPAQISAIRRNALGRQTELITTRTLTVNQLKQNYNAQRHQHQAQAVEYYPWLKNQETPEYQEAIQIVQGLPEVQRFPDFELWIADAVAGRMARLAKAKGAAAPGKTLGQPMRKPPGSKTPPRVVGAPTAAAPKVNPAKAEVVEAEKKFVQSGSRDDLGKMFAAKRRARIAG